MRSLTKVGFRRPTNSKLSLDKSSFRGFGYLRVSQLSGCYLGVTFLKLEDFLAFSPTFAQGYFTSNVLFLFPQCLLFILLVGSGTTEE